MVCPACFATDVMFPFVLCFLQWRRWCSQAHEEQISITSLRQYHWFPSGKYFMSRETCLKSMSHLRHALPPVTGIQITTGVAESHFHSLLSSQGQEQCWSTLCHIPLSHFTYDMMQPDITCLEGWENVISVSTGTEHQPWSLSMQAAIQGISE